jgi:hypothetical protein
MKPLGSCDWDEILKTLQLDLYSLLFPFPSKNHLPIERQIGMIKQFKELEPLVVLYGAGINLVLIKRLLPTK